MQGQLFNIERIREDLDVNYHQMRHFIAKYNWGDRSFIAQVSREVNSILSKRKLTGWIIDESWWGKKGNKSVGVGWQYCGNVGKISNSQVAVFACLSNGEFASMVYPGLYLPEDWCDDTDRSNEVGLPNENMAFKTKMEIAVDIIHQQIKNGVYFDYVGNDANLARAIDQMDYMYMLDIHSDPKISLTRTELFLPERKSNREPAPQRLKASIPYMSVSEYMQSLLPTDREKIKVRNTAKGKLTGKYYFVQVFVWHKGIKQVEPRILVFLKTLSAKNIIEIKYSFTNANLEQYRHQAPRFFVEHCIKESKQIQRLDQLQTRKWLAWQHQVALNFLVSSFILKEKLRCFEDLPLLLARDI